MRNTYILSDKIKKNPSWYISSPQVLFWALKWSELAFVALHCFWKIIFPLNIFNCDDELLINISCCFEHDSSAIYSEWNPTDLNEDELKGREETAPVNRSSSKLPAEVSASTLGNWASLGQNPQKVWIIQTLQSKTHKIFLCVSEHFLSSKANVFCHTLELYSQVSYTGLELLFLARFVLQFPREM